jgi:hypothetical protein
MDVEHECYVLGYRIAEGILRNGVGVVADSCNPIEITRVAWEAAAVNSGAHGG